MNSEQKILYKEIIKYVSWVEENKPIPKTEFPKFLDSKAGHDKTFLINTICYAIRARKKIILLYGTTALAALLYEGTTYTYFSYDCVKENDKIINDHPTATQDYLVQLTHPGIPSHEIYLKVGAICSIMRNISIDKGLVKNQRVIIPI
ncbi:10387_t:CDS:2 [Gigaspora margarita]|uniref:ATP-dependent DNA helicase n=1 Tax=Gigaspora margarita TaxID=4874 RepID=A0ABN7V698_GIGMA|nr:10387_t:CDS:2 [Gigaspora margarita]